MSLLESFSSISTMSSSHDSTSTSLATSAGCHGDGAFEPMGLLTDSPLYDGDAALK